MYAVVKERTREIGVKMALGAKSHWVTGPIVLEGLTYTLLGGVTGLLMALVIITPLSLIPTGNNVAIEMIGKADALSFHRSHRCRYPRHHRSGSRLLPRATSVFDRPGRDPTL